MNTSERALREVERAIDRGDLDEAQHLLNDVDRLNTAIRDVLSIEQPYRA